MDVRCERCGTEYEFEDSRITEAGIMVKCTHCGHLFKVARSVGADEVGDTVLDHRPRGHSGEPPGSDDAAGAPEQQWRIKKQDGTILAFGELSTLQQWILERKVSRHDQISKSGESWKTLSSIVELSSFFLAVSDAPDSGPGTTMHGAPAPRDSGVTSAPPLAAPPPPSSSPPAPPPPAPPPPAPPPPAPSSAPPPPASSQPPPPGEEYELLNTGDLQAFSLELPGSRPPVPPTLVSGPPEPTQPSLAVPTTAGEARMARGDVRERSGQSLPRHPPAVPQQRIQQPPRRSGLEQTDPGQGVQGPQAFGSSGDFDSLETGDLRPVRFGGGPISGLVVGVLVVMAGVGGFIVFKHLDSAKEGPPPVDAKGSGGAREAKRSPDRAPPAKVAAGVKKLIERAEAGYDLDTERGFAIATKAYSAALKGLASGPDDDLALRVHLGRARVALARAEYRLLFGEQADSALSEAEESLAAARELVPRSVDVDLGFADYYRVSGERPSVERYIKKLSQAGAGDRDELRLVRAAVALRSGADPKDLVAVAEAIEALPQSAKDLPRARFLAAEAWRLAGEVEKAREAFEQVLVHAPEHGPAKRRLASLGGGKPASGEKAAKPEVVEPKPVRRRRARRARSRPREAGGEEPPPSGGFEIMMSRGDRLLGRGKPKQALRYFESAAKKNPRSPEPWSNQGWCYLDMGNQAKAIGLFRKALSRSGRYGDAMYGLGVAQERAGQREQARTSYETYLRDHPRGSKARFAKRKLERLK